jgi:FMN-dependent NADH-azoreductase
MKMAKLFYIQASPRAERSKSNSVAEAFVKAYKQVHPQDSTETLNVFSANLPAFDGLTVQAKYTILHGKSHSNEELVAWKAVEKIIEQFKSADKYVLSVPMWNFSIPYRLKHYIDLLIQPGYTFSFEPDKGFQGLVKDKPLLVVFARGGTYAKGTEGEQFDLQRKYIELVFGFIGFTDIETIVVEPTLQGGPGLAQQKVGEAIEKAEQFALSF